MDELPSPRLSTLIQEKEREYTPYDDNDQEISNDSGPSPMSELDSTDHLSLQTTMENKQADSTISNNRPAGCSHKPGQVGPCSLCEHIVSPPRPRLRGLRQPLQPGVGSGHGRKVSGWCSGRPGEDSIDNDIENVPDEADAFKSPRIKKDRKQSELPPRRQTRRSSISVQPSK